MRRLLLSVTLVLAACGGGEAGGDDAGEGHDPQGTLEIGDERATNHGSADLTDTSEFELELDDFYFGPTVLQGEAGQQVTLTMHNEGDAAHTFTIEELGIDEELQPGDEGVSVDVTFPDAGSLPFVCTFHRGQGMLGALSVGELLESGGGSSEHHEEEPAHGPGYE